MVSKSTDEELQRFVVSLEHNFIVICVHCFPKKNSQINNTAILFCFKTLNIATNPFRNKVHVMNKVYFTWYLIFYNFQRNHCVFLYNRLNYPNMTLIVTNLYVSSCQTHCLSWFLLTMTSIPGCFLWHHAQPFHPLFHFISKLATYWPHKSSDPPRITRYYAWLWHVGLQTQIMTSKDS